MTQSTQVMTLADLKNQLAQKLQDQKSMLPPPTSTTIRITREGFVLPDGRKADQIVGVVVDMRYINALYTKRYVPGQVESPTCWAVSADANDMTPSEKSAKVQAPSCIGCPHNEWGSAGAGKTCKNTIRLALVTSDSDAKAPVFIMNLAPTSTGPFLKELRALVNDGTPYQTALFQFDMDNSVDYPKILSKVIGPAPDALAPSIMPLIVSAQDRLNRGFDYDA